MNRIPRWLAMPETIAIILIVIVVLLVLHNVGAR